MSRLLGVVIVVATVLAIAVLVPVFGKAQNAPPSVTPLQLLAQAQPASPPASQPSPAPPPAAQADMPTGYVGAETCKGCHEESYTKFARTKMGRLFLKGPRNARESLAGENCHGPGRAHVEAGGGKGKGDLPTSGTAAQRATATAQSFPAFANQLIQVTTRLRYNFWKGWTASVFYTFEQFRQKNWQTDDLNPFIPGVTSIWLGNKSEDYTANIVGATLGYRF